MVFEALEKLIEGGFPQQSFINLALKKGKELFYFGSICLSAGKKIIWFPSTIGNTIESTPTGRYIGKRLHHLSLAENLRKWHITLEEGEHISPETSIERIGENLFYWFSFNLKNLDSLKKFRKNDNKYQIKRTFTGIPTSHSGKRSEFLSKTLNTGGMEVLIPSAIQYKPLSQENKYFHFSFLIDKEPHKLKKINFINPPLKCGMKGMSTAHKIRIQENFDIVIICAWLIGRLEHKILYNWLKR